MAVSLTDEIIDAILQNEHSLLGRTNRTPRPRTPWAPSTLADLKPDWGQCLPGTQPDLEH